MTSKGLPINYITASRLRDVIYGQPLTRGGLSCIYIVSPFAVSTRDGPTDIYEDLLREEGGGSEPACQVAINSVLGRHLVATRRISAGEIILRCKPLVFGPKASKRILLPNWRYGT